MATNGIDIITSDPGEVELEQLQYHPKVFKCLKETLYERNGALKSCKPDELIAVQTWVAALEFVIGLPQKILDKERAKKAKP